MVKNLQIYSNDPSIQKRNVHRLVQYLKKEFNLNILFLSISFISSPELRVVNKKYLKHDFDTDIITFNYSKITSDVDGEILISLDEAKRNARKFNVTYDKEIFRLIIHGMLHLLNFDDMDASSKKIMKKEENKLINKYYFTLLRGK